MSAERKERLTVLTLTVMVGVTRFIPLSRGPWDWDEVLFCLALGDYDLGAHQPHPAGFPLFILLGKFARLFASSDFHALQAVNVVASWLVFPAMFAVARAFRLDFFASISAALVFSFFTNVWFYGGTAFSDPLGMLLYLGAIAGYLAATGTRGYVAASVALAAGVLVRPQNAIVAVFPWTLATVRLLRARRFRAVVAGSLALLLLAGIGYGIVAYVTGFEKYINVLSAHSQYVARADSVNSIARPPLSEVLMVHLDPFDAGKVMLLINLLALVAIVAGRRHVVAEVLLTFVPFLLVSMLAANPAGSSRFSLNYLAGPAILAIEGTDVLARLFAKLFAASRERTVRLAVLSIVVAVLLGRLITWGLPAFETPRNTIAPPTAAAAWLNEHVPATSTLFVDGSAQPWVKYFAPRHPRVVVGTTAEMLSHRSALNGWYIELAPPPPDGVVTFVRPRNRTWNIVTKRAFEAFVQPASEVLGFGDGWYNLEDDGVQRWRWSAQRAVIRFGPARSDRELHLQFLVPVHVHRKPVRVTFTLDGETLDSIVAKADNEVRFVIHGNGKARDLVIQLSDVFVPAQSGESGDQRRLGLMLRSWTWRRIDTAAMSREAAQ
ncbi:MAG: DUF2723 domain-containing protein [Acidobacteriota bacterium]|nr:DUF2723 domain-containing protein [Acidobacteriota bacterium]